MDKKVNFLLYLYEPENVIEQYKYVYLLLYKLLYDARVPSLFSHFLGSNKVAAV